MKYNENKKRVKYMRKRERERKRDIREYQLRNLTLVTCVNIITLTILQMC